MNSFIRQIRKYFSVKCSYTQNIIIHSMFASPINWWIEDSSTKYHESMIQFAFLLNFPSTKLYESLHFSPSVGCQFWFYSWNQKIYEKKFISTIMNRPENLIHLKSYSTPKRNESAKKRLWNFTKKKMKKLCILKSTDDAIIKE